MNKETKMSTQIKSIMEEELQAQGKPSLRKFTDWLTEGMTKEGENTISHVTVNNWQKGQLPSTDILEDILAVYPNSDRRFLFALRMLAAKSPHVWGPDGVIWTLKNNHPNK